MQTLTETELNGRICNKEFHTSNFGTKKIMIYKEKHVSIKHAVLVEIREKGLLVVAIVANGSP